MTEDQRLVREALDYYEEAMNIPRDEKSRGFILEITLDKLKQGWLKRLNIDSLAKAYKFIEKK